MEYSSANNLHRQYLKSGPLAELINLTQLMRLMRNLKIIHVKNSQYILLRNFDMAELLAGIKKSKHISVLDIF